MLRLVLEVPEKFRDSVVDLAAVFRHKASTQNPMPHIKFIILASALLLFWLVLSYIVPIKPNEVVGTSPLDRADVANSNQGVLSEK